MSYHCGKMSQTIPLPIMIPHHNSYINMTLTVSQLMSRAFLVSPVVHLGVVSVRLLCSEQLPCSTAGERTKWKLNFNYHFEEIYFFSNV